MKGESLLLSQFWMMMNIANFEKKLFDLCHVTFKALYINLIGWKYTVFGIVDEEVIISSIRMEGFFFFTPRTGW